MIAEVIAREPIEVIDPEARAIDFRNRDPEAFVDDDRRWTTGFVGGDDRWLRDDGRGGCHLGARAATASEMTCMTTTTDRYPFATG